MSDFSQTPERSGLEPELGSVFREDLERSGLEPELGGELRQKGVYVDETTCIGCKHCAHTASNTFYIEDSYGRARVINQNGDSEVLVEEAIDTCPVNCIHWLDYNQLKQLEEERKYQIVLPLGFPPAPSTLVAKRKQKDQDKNH
ncbi:MAG: ferredoxin [Spirulinaceae cyanobacterium]